MPAMRTNSEQPWTTTKVASRKATNPPMKTASTNSGPITNQVRARRNRVERRHTSRERRWDSTTAAKPTTISSITRQSTGRNSGSAKGLRGTAGLRPFPALDHRPRLGHPGLGLADQGAVVVAGGDGLTDADHHPAGQGHERALGHHLLESVQVHGDHRHLGVDGDVGEALLEAGGAGAAGAGGEDQHRPAAAGQVLEELERLAAGAA